MRHNWMFGHPLPQDDGYDSSGINPDWMPGNSAFGHMQGHPQFPQRPPGFDPMPMGGGMGPFPQHGGYGQPQSGGYDSSGINPGQHPMQRLMQSIPQYGGGGYPMPSPFGRMPR